NLDILFVNAMFAKMLGYENIDEFSKKSAMSAWDFVYKDDIENLRKLAADRIGKSDPYEIAYRVVKKDGAIVWVNQNSSHTYDENKNEIIFAYYTDITAQKQMEQDILAGKKKYEILINSIPGGVGMYKCNAEFKPIFMSDRVYELCGMTKDEYCYATRNSTLDVFHPDDRQGLIDTVSAAYNENRKFGYTHRVLQKDGTYRWMRVSGQVIASPDGELILYAVFTDVHEQIKAEYALSESEFRYATAIKASNINIWEYNYDADTMTIFSKSPKINSKNLVIPQYTKSIIDDGHIREDSAAVFFDMLKALKNGADEITCDLWIRENKNDDFWCERVTYTNIFSEDGKPQKAYCIGHDVTKEKEAEKRYLDELSYREAMQKATMISINVNLTRNTILDYKSNFSQVTSHIQASKTVQEYFDQVYTELTTTDMRKKCMSVFNREAMLKSFANGQTTISMELTRKIEGRRYWTILTAHMMKKTEDNEIIAFLYSTNVTNEKTMQNVMNAIVKTDYDFLVVVDATRNSAVRYSQNDFGNDYAYESENFEEQTREYVKLFVCDDDIAHVVQEITLENILSNLDSHETYSIFYKVTDSDGRILHKQLRFSYINRELKSFLMTRVDITAAIKEQDKKNSELVTAVKMAEHANAAKSEFLSRISHEIRTPMNAVIGMSQIALNSLDDKALAAESIKKSLYASQYLLLLLGDILDMSKIESGNVTLKNELIVCRRFLDAIDTIITTQANAKGVTYIVNECENHEEGYFGDSVRVQQILINVLT
ncbi:MAG: PAS domain-containing protein, partial [Clostridia bacterium]